MSFSQAARYVGNPAGNHAASFGDPLAGFSVPGIEVTEYPCGPDDEGDVCRARSSNRRDHGYLTRLNIARASHPNVPYGCPDRGLECTVPHIRTTAFAADDDGNSTSSFAGLVRRRYKVQRLRDDAQARRHQQEATLATAVAGVRHTLNRSVAGERQRQVLGSNGSRTAIHYIPFPEKGNDYDLIMTPRR